MIDKPLAVVIAGPTGAGKTAAALQLAAQLPVEIISVDSAQVYRGFDIGTAKPAPAVRARVPHHLIDIRDPLETYSAGEFVTDTGRLIGEIVARGRLPLLVGGTMLYFRALFGGLAAMPQGNPDVRQQIDRRAARDGWPALHAQLARIDAEAAARIHPNDPQRIQRALEVHAITGRTITELQRETRADPVANFLRFALVPGNRAPLHERNRLRLEAMLRAGFLEEVRALHGRGDLHARSNSVRAVGYQQLWLHLDGAFSLDEAVLRTHAATRQLVKRQLTWIHRETGWIRLEPDGSPLYPLLRPHLSPGAAVAT